MIHVSRHACERWVQRVDPSMTLEQAHSAIMASAKAIEIAAAFGCCCLRLANGAKLVLEGDTVVTVKERGMMVHRSPRPRLAA